MDSERFWILPEEKLYIRDDPQSHVIDGQLLEAERQPPAPLEPPSCSLDDVASPIPGLVEVLVAGLVLPRQDHRPDVPPLEPVADAGVTVPFVARPPLRPALAASPTRPVGTAHDLLKALGLVALACRHPHGQEDAVAVANQVCLGSETAPRAPKCMVLRLLHLHRFRPAQLRWRVGIFFSPQRRTCG